MKPEITTEENIIKEMRERNNSVIIPFQPNLTRFLIPKIPNYNEIVVTLIDVKCEIKRLIFSSLYAAFYQVFFSEGHAKSLKMDCRVAIPSFVEYLNIIEISESNRISVLKDFEAYRVKEFGVKTQSTHLVCIIKLINIGIKLDGFIEAIQVAEINYLDTLTKTKVAPPDEKGQITLSNWISFHSWLRRDDIGLGNDLFMRVASPKALMASFITTAEVALLEIQAAKYALVEFIRNQDIQPHFLVPPEPQPSTKSFSKNEYKIKLAEWTKYIYACMTDRFTFLQKKYYSLSNPSPALAMAFEIIIYSWCPDRSINYVEEMFKAKKGIKPRYKQKNVLSTQESALLFSNQFLFELAEFVQNKESIQIPITNSEHLLFQWLMAYHSVQPSDVLKLRLTDFRFMRRRSGHVTHIECDYFKGRANDTHYLNCIKGNSDMGQGILNYISDLTNNESYNNDPFAKTYKSSSYSTSVNGGMGQFIRFVGKSSLRQKLDDNLAKKQVTPIFINALNLIIEKGITFTSFKRSPANIHLKKVTRQDWMLLEDTPSKLWLFGLEAIKNSGVHARTDSFTPTQLQNYNSHTNETERENYLTESNLEWKNNSGLITRAVMQDIHINVLAPSKKDIQLFNSEFTRTSELIDKYKNDVYGRLKVITGHRSGTVDELGFINTVKVHEGDYPDTLYLLDSPETVMRIYSYLKEAQIKHKQLAKKSNEYFLFTVLPTVEWMSILLAEHRFSKKNIEKGREMFNRFESILPSNFSAQLGSN